MARLIQAVVITTSMIDPITPKKPKIAFFTTVQAPDLLNP
jgi:hypothetical protein